MNDIFLLLQPYLQSTNTDEPCLLVADENLIDIPFANLDPSLQVLSNRFDIARQAQLGNCASHFNDFDFSVFPKASFKRVVYRVSKEKPVAHHIINHAMDLLSDGGELIILGAKNEGIKTYAKKAADYFNTQATISKHGTYYLATLQKNTNSANAAQSRLLPLKTPYESLAPVVSCDGKKLYSKPGLFGWNKVDRGSALLAQHLNDFFSGFATRPSTLLDLGCGYGYLSVMAAQALSPQCLRIVASDNCAAAIIACRKNFAAFNIAGEVVADDCASEITDTFDALLCNPPFHQGFKTDSRLTEKFLKATARHLKQSGRALFVVNQFVPLEKLAQPLFARSEKIAQAEGFKLVVLSKR
ncbi:MAG: class I SAM-dependent methyltransferase [Gammaproteobacteria bacterium]|nr:class I SAM-dependent methyltransferase [Gammaproteobacteria bacterium]MBQ0840875.1 class I SAM-dependent methyltransferase [Gammaproteobacteria bacterium]